MNRLFLSLFLVLIFASAAFSQATGKIAGRVVFGGDSNPLHQVSVRIVENKRATTTDDDGVYEFTSVAPGRYTVVAHQEGFSDLSKTVVLVAGGNAAIDFKLQLTGVKEQVTITATGSEQSTFDSIASVSTVDSTRIAERAAIGIGEVLDKEPGVAKRSFGPGNSRPVIRGFDGDRVLVATDGVRLGSLASQSGDHAEPLDVLAVERIEVVKGPATLLYGGNAIGGVVNAISGHDEGSHPGLRGTFSAIGGTNSDQASVGGGAEYGVKNWMFWGSGSGQRTGDYSAGRDFGKVVNSFTRSAAGNLGFGYYAKHAFVNGNYNYYQSRYGIPLDFNETDPELRSLRVWRQGYKTNFGLSDLNSIITGVKITLDYSNYRHQELAESTVGTTFRNRLFSYRAILDQRKAGRITGRFGVEGYHRNFSTVGSETLINGPVVQNAFSAFGLEEVKFERVTLQFGGRVENNRYKPTNPLLPNRNFTGFSGAAGARFALWKGGAFVANYSHAFRAPALEELYNNGPHDGTLSFEIGDSNLKPERSDGIDLSLRQQASRVRFEGNFYYYNLKNFVFLSPSGLIDDEDSGLPFANYLQGDSRFYGTEVTADATVSNYFNILGGIDYVNAQLKDGRPLPRIPPFRGRFGVDLHYKNASLRPEFIAVSTQNRIFALETATRGYGVFNVAANYVIPARHFANILFVSAYNLSNELYFNHISFIKDISPEIGRGVKFGYTVRFF